MPKKDTSTDDKLADQQESIGLDPAFQSAPSPNFNQPWKNDVRLVDRGFFKGVVHFVNKNTENLSRSIFDRVVSSMKHAGCVNNYTELRQRWRRLKELEEAEMSPGRVRFINYYTASTGRISPKNKTKPVKDTEDSDRTDDSTITTSTSQGLSEVPETPGTKEETPTRELSETPSIPTEEAATPETEDEPTATMDHLTLREQEPRPMTPGSDLATEKGDNDGDEDDENREKHDEPTETSTPPSPSTQEEESTPSEHISLSTADSSLGSEPTKPKLRKFILLPSHHWKYDNDAHWAPIVMEDMDEVAAHQSMFIPQGKNYDHLVGDCVALIEQWVQGDLSGRLVRENYY